MISKQAKITKKEIGYDCKMSTGDCNNDNKADICDLVRAKKYLADLTYDIKLVNIDYDNDGFVKTTDLASLKKQPLGIN